MGRGAPAGPSLQENALIGFKVERRISTKIPRETRTKLESQNASYLWWLSSSLAKYTSVMLSRFKEAVRCLKLHQS